MAHLLGAVCEIYENTKEDDHYGDYSFRDYQLEYEPEVYEILIELSLVKNYTGSRMANLFCTKDKKKLKDFIVELDKKITEHIKQKVGENYVKED